MPKEVEPDYKHAFRLFKSIILLPVTLILVLFRKKGASELISPLKELWDYFWEAKFTAILIIANIIISFTLMFYLGSMPEQQQVQFAHRYLFDGPANLLSLNIIPLVANWFVHLSMAHLFGNMLALLILGRVVEKNFSTPKYAIIYFGSAVVSGLVDSLVHINNLGYYATGASGAIAGLASAAMLIEPFYIVCIFLIPLPVFLFGWLQLYTDVTGVLTPNPESHIANFAHLGGFFAITLLSFLMTKEERSKLVKGIVINIATFAVLALAWYARLRHIV